MSKFTRLNNKVDLTCPKLEGGESLIFDLSIRYFKAYIEYDLIVIRFAKL